MAPHRIAPEREAGMLVRLLRILVAFALGCFAASVTLILFVFTPSEILGLPPDVRADRLGKAVELAAFAAIQIALFSAPFALVASALGEMMTRRFWSYYALAGLLMAGAGFFAQRTAEQIGQPTIANNYALTAFLTAGFVGGLVYWMVAGRFAGRRVRVTRPLEADAHWTSTDPLARSTAASAPPKANNA
jgi:hypothetical protein